MRHPLYALIILLLISCNDAENGGIQFKEYAYVRSGAGILRSDPVAIAPELEILKYGSKIQILRKTSQKVKIGSADDYWYLVRNEDLIEGWIYGNAITFSSGDIKEKTDEDISLDPDVIRENLIGKWWEIRDDGSTGLGKVYFWSDGKYTHGYGRSEMSEGKYEIIKNSIVLDHGSSGGNRLEIFEVGDEYRLTGKKKGISVVFIKGDPDPESPEMGDPEAEDSTNETNSPEGKPD